MKLGLSLKPQRRRDILITAISLTLYLFLLPLSSYSLESIDSMINKSKNKQKSLCEEGFIQGVTHGKYFQDTFCFSPDELKNRKSYITTTGTCYKDQENPENSFIMTGSFNRLEVDSTSEQSSTMINFLSSELEKEKKNLENLTYEKLGEIIDEYNKIYSDEQYIITEYERHKQEPEAFTGDDLEALNLINRSIISSKKSHIFFQLSRDTQMADYHNKEYKSLFENLLQELENLEKKNTKELTEEEFSNLDKVIKNYIQLKEKTIQEMKAYKENLKNQTLSFCEKKQKRNK